VRQAHTIEWFLTFGSSGATIDAGASPDWFCDINNTSLGTATVTRAASGQSGSTAANTMVVSFPRSWLVDCGLTGNSYTYSVFVTHETDLTGDDSVPDSGEITHNLDPVSGPTTTTTTLAATTTTTVVGATTTTTVAGGTTTTTVAGGTTTTTAAGATTSTTAAPGGTTSTTQAGTTSTGTVNDNTVTPGQKVVFTARGFGEEEDLDAEFRSTPVSLGQVTSDANGNVRATFTIPTSATAGSHQIVVFGPGPNGETHTAIANVTVVAAGGTSLPITGADTGRLVMSALLLIAWGAYMVLWRRSVANADFWF
jgi:hypothetical protein